MMGMRKKVVEYKCSCGCTGIYNDRCICCGKKVKKDEKRRV